MATVVKKVATDVKGKKAAPKVVKKASPKAKNARSKEPKTAKVKGPCPECAGSGVGIVAGVRAGICYACNGKG